MIKQWLAVFQRMIQRPWQSWGGCTNPEYARYLMDYASGWLDNPEAVPELAERAPGLKLAVEAHLAECLQCRESLRSWQASTPEAVKTPDLVDSLK